MGNSALESVNFWGDESDPSNYKFIDKNAKSEIDNYHDNMEEKMTNMYETWLSEEIQNIDNFPYEDIKVLDKYPLEVSKQVLKVLIENSCLGQNYGPIEISRKKINEIDKVWLKQYLIEVASTCIDYSDEWEYRRLVELIIFVMPDLKKEILKLGAQSENEEVREVVEDFRNL